MNLQKEDYETCIKEYCRRIKIGTGKLIHPFRLAVSGVGSGPGVFDIVDIIGKEETIRRIEYAIQNKNSKLM